GRAAHPGSLAARRRRAPRAGRDAGGASRARRLPVALGVALVTRARRRLVRSGGRARRGPRLARGPTYWLSTTKAAGPRRRRGDRGVPPRGRGPARLGADADRRGRLMCGVFGIRAPGRDVARVAHFGLHALQHRGQESAGIAVSDRGLLTVLRDLGLVTQVFDEQNLSGLHGELAIGHTRYSTTGASKWENAQPGLQHGRVRTVAVGHHGNLT